MSRGELRGAPGEYVHSAPGEYVHTPLFRKAYYGMVASVIRDALRMQESDAARAAVVMIKADFIVQFQRDNPEFDIEKFNEACNP